MANLAEVLKELQQERSRLDEAIRVIGQLVSGNHTGARGTKLHVLVVGRRTNYDNFVSVGGVLI
jgi:hypothetical protein